MNIKICIFLLGVGIVPCKGDIVDDYANLINGEIQRASTYKFPKDASEYKAKNIIPKDYGTFDFIVVGGGSAGAVVTSRLSEINKWKVLLLEAGKEGNNFTDIPAMSTYTLNLEYNWGYNTTRQTTCCLATKGVCPYPRGKGLGGSSIINALIYARGNAADYNDWEAQGNPGWSYKDVLPYFIKSENSNINGDEGYHGSGGYLDINYHVPTSEKVNIFLEANKEQGIETLDYNGREQLGASRMQFTTMHGKRESSAKAFLDPAWKRTNLNILTRSYVTKILISSLTQKAYGVLFSHNNILYTAKARKEIVLSAGVFGSAQLLMLSGIGPKEHLAQHGIRVKKNLAVGKNMHDHLTLYNMYFSTPNLKPSVDLRKAIRQYLYESGPLTISTDPQGVAFFQLGLTNTSKPDIELVIQPSASPNEFDALRKGLEQENGNNSNTGSFMKNDTFLMMLMLQHPKTRGQVLLKSNDPYDYPLIDSRCLDDPDNEDIENMYRGVKRVLKLMKTKAFKKLGAKLLPYQNCMKYVVPSRNYWECVIRQTATNAYHGAGTCSMGPDPSKGAVVDNKLRVHGIKNLRVADTSIVPFPLAAHMNAPAMMIGERVADFIKERYSVSQY